MKSKEFKKKSEKLIDKLEVLIDDLPHKGDTQEVSQKILLINLLNQFRFGVNGVRETDFEERDETEENEDHLNSLIHGVDNNQ